MATKLQKESKIPIGGVFIPASTGQLQRKCVCGSHTMMNGECEACAKKKGMLQRKLTIGASNDPLEQEADRVADQVMSVPFNLAVTATPPGIQPYTEPARDCLNTVLPSVDRVLASSGKPFEPALRLEMESRFGHDFSQVRVHIGSAAEQSARDVNANAYSVGNNIVFGTAQFAPGTQDGRRLIAHELTHVVQQSGLEGKHLTHSYKTPTLPSLSNRKYGLRGEAEAPGGQSAELSIQRQAAEYGDKVLTQPATVLNLDFDAIVDKIYKAIAGMGTDEEAVYRALQLLQRDPGAIKKLKEIYRHRYKLDLVEDIRDDFSGEELEYALQLLNLGSQDSKQRVTSEPQEPRTAARRIREAFLQRAGTDEEAVYAALLPFRRDTLKVQRAYQEEFQEDLRDRIEEEMSGSELGYALDLLETPFERFMQEASSWLNRYPSIGFGLPWNRDDWFDGRFWKRKFDAPKKEWKLVLSNGEPHEAIDALFHEQGRWHVDCAVFVEVVQLYALRQSLGAKRFDQRIGKRMELRAHGSTGTFRRMLFKRSFPSATFTAEGNDVLKRIGSVEEVLAEAPIGSRVRWTSQLLFDKANNLFGPEVFTIEQQEWPNWQHENTIKLGPDRYGAHGVGNRVSREEVESKIAEITDDVFPDKSKSEIRAGIFVSEIELFERPVISEQIDPSATDSEKGERP